MAAALKNGLLWLSSYLYAIVYKPTYDAGLSVIVPMAVVPPLFAFLILLGSLLRLSINPTLGLLLFGVFYFWFGEYAKRFVVRHRTAIIARSRTLKGAPFVAVGILVLSFLLFALLVTTAGEINHPGGAR